MPILSRRDLLKAIPLAAAPPVVAQTAEIPKVGDAPQLFVDYDLVERVENVVRTFHAAEKHADNPVLRKEKPWESDRGTWGSVSYDQEERIFKAWYGGISSRDISGCSGMNCPSNSVLCYGLSQDGIHWERPKLKLFEVFGTRDNNIVIDDVFRDGKRHWESVLKDPMDPDPQRRYKALGWSSYDWDGPLSGIISMTSPDGLHWTQPLEPIIHFHPRPNSKELGPIGDAQAMMIDTLRRRYVAYLRKLPHRVMSVSTDFVHWTPPEMCIEARDGEYSNNLYNHVGFVYGDRYLGFLTYFTRDLTNPILSLRLITSRDGDRWQRPDTGVPLIGPGDLGEVDRFTNMLTGAPPIRVGNRLYIYYRTMVSRHGFGSDTRLRQYEGKDIPNNGGGGICLASLRVDGFASLASGFDGGLVITRPFRFTGSSLKLNAKANHGQLAVEVLDEKQNPIPGFERQKCEPMQTDSVDHSIRWKDASLATLQARPVRLRFLLANARLYSYRITA